MNYYRLPDNLTEEIKNYEKLVKQYQAGDLPSVKMKAVRVPFGVYEQREPETYMCRVRLPGGAITPEQLIGVAEIAEKYSDRPLHFTTRQEVQIHHVTLADTVLILKALQKLGLSTRGGGGNTVRNIIGSVGAEVFDVAPYAQALTSRLIAESDSWELPRKLKIAFSDGPTDKGLATVNDLGFIAKIGPKGKKGFAVYVAGGLGARPQTADLLYDFVPDDQVYNIAKAVKILFDKFGNRKNKYAARLRFLFNKLGKEEFIRRFEEELKTVRQKKYPALQIKEIPAIKSGQLVIPLLLGDLAATRAKQIGILLKQYGSDVIRTMTTQNLLVRNVQKSEVTQIKKQLDLDAFPPLIGQAVACAGASTCRLGICLSRDLLVAVKDRFAKETITPNKIDDLSLKISGCPNSCGQHQIADIGLFGVAKRFHGRLVPCYTLLLGGVVQAQGARLAEKYGVIPARNIPAFLFDLLKFVQATRKLSEPFALFLERVGRPKITEILSKYEQVPDFDQAKNYYFDWSATEPFSVAAKVEGECSAGLFDLIEWDFNNIDNAFARLEELENDQALLRTIILSSARALLVTKGLEPKDDQAAVKLFAEHFIGKHIAGDFKSITDKYLAGKDFSLSEAQQLSNTVRELYDSMDNSLKFPELEPKDGVKTEKMPEKEEVFRDYRGVACPMNFVKTKLVLETMRTGERLQILLDDGEPIDNVPASVKAEGHKIIKQEKVDNHWSVIIEKVA